MTDESKKTFNDNREYLRMFQHIINNSSEKNIYNFALNKPYDIKNKQIPLKLQDCNKIFYVNPKKVPEEFKDKIVYLAAAYIRHEYSDIEILAVKVIKDLYNDEDAIISGTPRIRKITGIEYDIPCMIINESLDKTYFQKEWLNYEYYNHIIRTTYQNSWQNNTELYEEIEENEY